VTEPPRYGDALNAPFWEAARRRELVLQHCGACGAHQLYARPFCLACGSDTVGWVAARGTGVVYSVTTVRMAFSQDHEPPYAVGLVELDEGVRVLTSLPGGCPIGARVQVAWKERDPDPPLPVFTHADEGGTS
jgi:uncharacterized OB-fold protein